MSRTAAKPVILTVAPTGPLTTREQHPGVPLSPREIGVAVAEAAAAGASVAHVHARDELGEPTADPAVYRAIVEEIEQRCDVVVQSSTGVGLEVPPEVRLSLIEDGPPPSPMATLNVASMRFAEGTFENPPWMVERLASAFVAAGLKPELEIYDTGHLDLALAIAASAGIDHPLMFSFVMGVTGGMPPDVALLAGLVRRLPPDAVWQVIGIGRYQLPLLLAGLSLGGNVRVGFEDNVMLRSGVQARDNAEMVRAAAALIEGAGKAIATPDEARELLGLTARPAPLP